MRCVAENPSERFLTLADFKDAILSDDFESSKIYKKDKSAPKNFRKIYLAICAAVAALILFLLVVLKNIGADYPADSLKPWEIPADVYSKIKSGGFRSGAFFIEDIKTWKAEKMALLKVCEDNYKEAKILSEKSEAQVLAEVEEHLENLLREDPDLVSYSDEKRFREYRESEIKMALFNWRLARSNLADELENLKSLREDLSGERAYKEYVEGIYKNYLRSIE